MATIAAQCAPSVGTDNVFAREVRFGVVMYGGVSLAIYINGVANELYEMATATPKTADHLPASGTREVYRKLSWLLNDEGLRASYLAHLKDPQTKNPFDDPAALARAERTRLVVDVIAGTSAGGINGVFLAKALANGQAFAPLKKLWVQEGDIAKLLNDDASYEDIDFAKNDQPPRSLLNSDRMYLKLLDAMEAMATAVAPRDGGESALVDELDLYVTTTDIRGAIVPLRLFDKVVYEKRHKQVYHFQYAAAAGKTLRNDLSNDNTKFLAFAARCTASFPFAFEPMQVADAQRLCEARPGGGAVDFGAWKSFFTGLSADDLAKDRWRTRAFGDGGYLDNKPFSYVVEALSWRLGTVPMDRKLIYIEPAPTHPERERQVFADKPDAIENALAALTSIPQYETIREDLEAVLSRNRRIERVERIVRKVEADIELRNVDPFARVVLVEGKVPPWTSLDLGQMIDYYGVAFLPYQRLRLASVNDDLSDRLADWWGVDRRSDRLYALRALVRAWREQNYFENRSERTPTQAASVNAFLDDYDVKYRLRRATFLLRKTHQLFRLATRMAMPEAERPALTDIETRLLMRLQLRQPALLSMRIAAFIDSLGTLRVGFGGAVNVLRAAAWPQAPQGTLASDPQWRKTLDLVLRLLIGEKLDPPLTTLLCLDGSTTRLPLKDLPPPDPLRTLQENVFARAEFLFKAAGEVRRTQLQDLLERDITRLREVYALVIRPDPQQLVPRPRDILGSPTLGVKPVAGGQGGAAARVGIKMQDVLDVRYAAALNTPEGKLVREFLAEYYIRFDEYDQMSFPLYYDTGTGEPSTVEVLRVSPQDAPSLINEADDQGKLDHRRQKLAGTALFNFGGFLDAQWRRNDILWGRLDGCERLLAALLPTAKDTTLREALLGEAQRAILGEEMQPTGYAHLVDMFAQLLAEQPQSTLAQAFEGLWAQLAPGDDAQRQTRTALALKAVLGESGMVDYVRHYYEVKRRLDTEPLLKSGARALTISGQILEAAEKRYRGTSTRLVWLTRAGRFLQTLLAVSTPGSLRQSVFAHWLTTLYLFEATMFGGAWLLGAPTTQRVALTAFGLTAALHLASLLVGDLMQRQFGRAKVLAIAVVAVVLVLAGLGALGLLNGSLGVMLCGLWPGKACGTG